MKLVVLSVVLLVLCAPIARAQPATDPVATATEAERAVLGEVDRKKWIAAREKAQKVLATSPDSFVATWALALVHHYEEGNHARALFLVRRAEKLLVARGRDPVWHKKALEEESWILGEMDKTSEQLAVLDRIGKLYPPGRESWRIWPLLKQKRYEDARAVAEPMLGSDDYDERLSAHNGMLTIEEEQRHREAGYQRARAATDAFPQSCVINRNAGVMAWERFKHEQAEEWLLRGATTKDVDCIGSPYEDLARLYLAAGELQQSISAMKKANAVPIEKQYRPSEAMQRRAMLADLLNALGKPEDAVRLESEIYEQPDRTGTTSISADAARLMRAFRYWFALDTRITHELERASYRPVMAGLSARARLAATRWEVRRVIIQLAADKHHLITMTRPNLGDVSFPLWTTGGLIEILGTGVMASAVAEARKLDADVPEAAPYLDALEGEIAYRKGELTRAAKLATSALEGVPPREGLLRVRVMGWHADALWRLGKHDEALAAYHEVLQKLPSVVRVLDLVLPAAIKHDASDRAKAVADELGDSPRFTSSGRGMKIDITSRGKDVTMCLTDARGFQYACATSDKDVEGALDAFHAAAFSPKVAMTQSDLTGLDGSTSSRTADQALQGLLK